MPGQVQSIARAAAILRLLASSSGRLGIGEIARSLDLAKGTAHGIVRTLQDVGFVEQDKTSGKIDEDETDLAESYELPGADLSDEVFSVEVTPKQSDEFTCTSCFLVQHESRRSSQGVDLCADCA